MKQRVFLAADLKRMRGLLVDLFSSSGSFQLVGTACTENEATAWFLEHADAWDLAIVDLVLDEGSGTAVLRLARELDCGGLIAVLSSCVTDTLREHCYALGADKIFDEGDTAPFVRWLDKVGSMQPPHSLGAARASGPASRAPAA
jgi:two-component system, OmpR family, response regulator